MKRASLTHPLQIAVVTAGAEYGRVGASVQNLTLSRHCILAAENAASALFNHSRDRELTMGFDQYHEPPQELSEKIRTFARMIASLIEEAEAIGWYEQRMSVENDKEARAIMANAQKEQFKHFGMNLEFLLRRNKQWRTELQSILFTKGDIVKRGEAAEKKTD
jgi:hypothetical protein